ncbi:FtsX-like permease family protein [Streptomyces chromofuscus]|uniref:ABC transporter permease n=1 Tax=Streptomyces chromofuscus TaxID=42881 RepID=A0A7M2T9X2_STRCW|nr:ABC transporter permease [Streptomyces chromofuscus]QOV44735.1 ABC transporter permease [Streptomyces chromofuscus]GGT00703.1 ABC transporter permease [Streptomyces chromofuscus]
MVRLAFATVRARKGGFVGTFVALLLGSAVVSVCGILMESGLRTSMPPERYAAADVVVSGRQHARLQLKTVEGPQPVKQPLVEKVPVRADLARRIASVPGVADVTADIAVPADLIGQDGLPLAGANGAETTGHNWSSTGLGPYRLTSGRAPSGDREVVLDQDLARRAGAAAGETVLLMTGSTPEAFRVTGVVALDGDPSPRRSVLFFTDGRAERLAARTGFVDAFGIRAAAGTGAGELADAVSDALADPDLAVVTGDARGKAEFLDVATTGSTLVLLASAVGGNIVVVTVFVVASTLSLSITHRRREVALLRAVGATPRQVRRMVAAEALTVAVSGAVLGWPLGIAVVHWIRDHLARHGFVPRDYELVIGPLPAVGAALIAMATAYTAARVAARRATRVRPSEALGEAAVERAELGRGRLITGGVLVLGAVGLFVTGLTQGGDFAALAGFANSLVLVVVIAASVWGPVLARAATRALTPLLRMNQGPGFLAAANISAHARRLAGAVIPLVLSVSFAATVVFAETTTQHTAERQLRAGSVADHVLTSSAGLAPEVAHAVRELDQVEAATGVVRSKVVAVTPDADEERESLVSLGAQGVEPGGLHRTMDLQPREGSLGRLNDGTVALSTVASSWLDRGVGDTVRLVLGDGTALTPRVVAVYERGLAFADVTFDHDLLLAHTTARRDDSVLVRAAEGVDDLAPALAEVAQRYPGTVVQDRLDLDRQLEQQKANAWVNYLLVGLIIAYAGVTVVNTQAMNTVARRREFALLRLGGMTRAQVMRMMRWEALAVVLAGVGIGTLASVPALLLVSLALTQSLLPTVPPLLYLAIAGGTALLAATAALLPARLMLRTRPVDAIGSRE